MPAFTGCKFVTQSTFLCVSPALFESVGLSGSAGDLRHLDIVNHDIIAVSILLLAAVLPSSVLLDGWFNSSLVFNVIM